MPPKVDSLSFMHVSKGLQENEERNIQEDNPPVITVDPQKEDKNMGLAVERMGKNFIQEAREYQEIKMEIERKKQEDQLQLFTGIYHKVKNLARRGLNFLAESYKQYQKMQAENPNIANLYYSTYLDPYGNSSLY